MDSNSAAAPSGAIPPSHLAKHGACEGHGDGWRSSAPPSLKLRRARSAPDHNPATVGPKSKRPRRVPAGAIRPIPFRQVLGFASRVKLCCSGLLERAAGLVTPTPTLPPFRGKDSQPRGLCPNKNPRGWLGAGFALVAILGVVGARAVATLIARYTAVDEHDPPLGGWCVRRDRTTSIAREEPRCLPFEGAVAW
jgi:hypothetical protein